MKLGRVIRIGLSIVWLILFAQLLTSFCGLSWSVAIIISLITSIALAIIKKILSFVILAAIIIAILMYCGVISPSISPLALNTISKIFYIF